MSVISIMISIVVSLLPVLFVAFLVKGKKLAWIFQIIPCCIMLFSAVTVMGDFREYLTYAIVTNVVLIVICVYGFVKFSSFNGNFIKVNNPSLIKLFLVATVLSVLSVVIYKDFFMLNYNSDASMTVLDFVGDIVSIFALLLMANKYRLGLFILAISYAVTFVYGMMSMFNTMNNEVSYLLFGVNLFVSVLCAVILLVKFLKSRRIEV